MGGGLISLEGESLAAKKMGAKKARGVTAEKLMAGRARRTGSVVQGIEQERPRGDRVAQRRVREEKGQRLRSVGGLETVPVLADAVHAIHRLERDRRIQEQEGSDNCAGPRHAQIEGDAGGDRVIGIVNVSLPDLGERRVLPKHSRSQVKQ